MLIRARAGLDLRGPYCFCSDDFFVPNDHIFHCLNIPQNSPNLEHRSHLPKNIIIYYGHEFSPLGGAIIKSSTFCLITPIYLMAHSKTHIHLFTELCSISSYKPCPFPPPFYFVNLQTVTNLLFRTPLRQFHRLAPNFGHTICGPSWQKVGKRILIFQTTLKLLNNNFLQISSRQETLHISSMNVQMTWNSGHYFPMSPWGSVQKFDRWPLGGAL